MKKKKKFNFWGFIARLILRNRFAILLAIALVTAFWSTQWQYMRFTYSEANLLPDKHPENQSYNNFLDTFGEEGNVIIVALKDPRFFEPEKFKAWQNLSQKLRNYDEVESVISTDNLKQLKKKFKEERFEMEPVLEKTDLTPENLNRFKAQLELELPFYKNLIISEDGRVIRMLVNLDRAIVNTEARKDFVFKRLLPEIDAFEKQTQMDLKVSGMPYIRTLNAQNIVDEIGLFVGVAVLLTSLIFFLFFRSFRATFISMVVVLIGVMWALGLLGFLQYEITVLTALIPPLIIVIGVPNCIFLINKYQQEVAKHGNQIKSLQRVIVKIGNVTLMTNLTTASGFATFILTDSKILKEFGIVASANIIGIFLLSLFVIPIIYSFMALPNKKHLKHLKNKWMVTIVKWMEHQVRYNRINTYIISLIALVVGIIGIYQIKISGSIIEDMPKKAAFFEDIQFFEKEFNGVVPVEIMINSKRSRGVYSLATLNRIDRLEENITEIPELSAPISIVKGIKYAKQAYYNGNPNFFDLPTAQENRFIAPYLNRANGGDDLMINYIDSTGQYARMTTFMRDVPTDRMEDILGSLKEDISKIFPEDRFDVLVTGKALLFLKGTRYLIKNLFLSLLLAVVLIALFMAYMFGSFRMIIISLIPNLLPLIITAGVMGFAGIPLKPSTILVFSIAFGISVDDTIHFLAKYRQELIDSKWKIKRSIYAAIHETGISMFYTSVVLFFGFIVFMTSNFGGTVALGGLVAVTLLFAMLANLILLPSLLISLEDKVSNENILKKPKIKIIEENET
ncbi:MAG: MMPL family transporter [Bacteroidetes bacterium]|nr:MMPL family transporter [Bacteroidota bacterium]MDA0938028.1 MMPL family transporter [Bacteroidota bacterium]